MSGAAGHSGVEAVVFDLDGTLIHSAPDIHACLNRAMSDAGVRPFSLAEVTGFIGNGVPRLIERAVLARGLDRAEQGRIEQRFLDFYSADPVALTRPFEGVPELLQNLRARGLRLGVCTNKPQAPARDILARLGLETYFDIILGGDSVPQRKPHPEPLWRCFEQLGAAGCYVGDSEVDAECAASAGIPFLLFSGGYRKARISDLPHHAAFDRFAALPGLIDDLPADLIPPMRQAASERPG